MVLSLADVEDILTLEATGLDLACNRHLYGPDPIGQGAAWDASYCGHAEQLQMTATGGVEVPFVISLRTDDPVDITLGPAI